MPEIDIVAHPVFPEQVDQQHWWASRGTAVLLVSEYVKYLAAVSRPLWEWSAPARSGKPEVTHAELHR